MCVGRSEFCQFDEFEANCEEDEVIIMESAQYGRMRPGRCISGEGYMGCSADVRVYLDGHCSGRRQCTLSVASLTDLVQPCRRDFTSYLEASYKCMKGNDLLYTHTDRHLFFPVAVETLGALADDGHTFIREIGRRAALCAADPRETTFLYQRFSIAIQRFNSICLAKSFSISESSG